MSPEPPPDAPVRQTPHPLLVTGGAALAVILLLPTLLYPFGRDQAVFAAAGGVIAEGGVPYRDFWDIKPPGIYLAYSWLVRAAGGADAGFLPFLRGADLLVVAVTAVLLARLAARRPADPASWLAGGWYAALYAAGTFWGTAQAEAWANPLLLGAALLLSRAPEDPPAPRRAVAAGLLAGAAFVFKFTTVLPLLPFLAAACRRKDGGWTGLPVAAFLVGGAAAPVGMVAWLVTAGALDDYVQIQQGFVAPYTAMSAAGAGQIWVVLAETARWALRTWLPVVLAGAALVRLDSRPGPSGDRVWAGAFVAGLVAVWVQQKFFLYHWHTVIPFLAIGAARGTADLASLLRERFRPVPAGAWMLAAVLIWPLAGRWGEYRDATLHALGRLPRERWLARFGRPFEGDFSYLADEWAADWVRANSDPSDRLLVWGFELPIHLLSGRPPSSRFWFNVPVAVDFSPSEWRQEFLRGLETAPPRLVLVAEGDRIPWATGRADDSARQLAAWPELDAWLRSNYTPAGRLEHFQLFRRDGAAPDREE